MFATTKTIAAAAIVLGLAAQTATASDAFERTRAALPVWHQSAATALPQGSGAAAERTRAALPIWHVQRDFTTARLGVAAARSPTALPAWALPIWHRAATLNARAHNGKNPADVR